MLANNLHESLTDAMFETVSGFTTTGATVLTGLDQLPHAILYYRQQLQFLGGMGIIVLAVAILPMLVIGIFYIGTFAISIALAKRRLNDLNRSGWWFLLFLVPLINLILVIYLVFFPGTEGANTWGAHAVANSTAVKLLAWILPAIFLIGIIAAVAIPSYMQYQGG